MRISVFAASCAAVVLLAGTARAATYSIKDLTVLGGGNCTASDINDIGTIIGGRSYTGPIIFKNTGGYTLISNTSSDSAIAVNNVGEIVGTIFVPGGHTTTFFYKNGQKQDIGSVPGALYSTPYDINDSGVIVGKYQKSAFSSPDLDGGFTWQNGVFTDLGNSVPTAINNRGDIAGTFGTIGSRAFVLRNGVRTEITFDGAMDTSAIDINDAGQVLVRAYWCGGTTRYYVWKDGTATEIVRPGVNNYGVIPSCINNYGVVVGQAPAYLGGQAFIWQNGQFSYLDDLIPKTSGYQIIGARAINNSGQIIAGAYYGSEWRSVLLTPVPVPEPTSCLVLGSGLCGLAAFRRRR